MKQTPTTPYGRVVVPLRYLLALAAASAVTLGLGRLALSAAAPVAADVRAGGPATLLVLPLPDALAALAAVGALVCWTLLAAEAAAFATRLAWQVLRHGRPRAFSGRPSDGRPWPRRAALAALGLSVGAGALTPAQAAQPGGPGPEAVVAAARPLAGLPLPDRTPGAGAPEQPVVTVAPGDSLWSIAVSLAGERASTVHVAACWQRLLRANAGRLGADPDLIFPGTSLRAPRCDRPRKDRP